MRSDTSVVCVTVNNQVVSSYAIVAVIYAGHSHLIRRSH